MIIVYADGETAGSPILGLFHSYKLAIMSAAAALNVMIECADNGGVMRASQESDGTIILEESLPDSNVGATVTIEIILVTE